MFRRRREFRIADCCRSWRQKEEPEWHPDCVWDAGRRGITLHLASGSDDWLFWMTPGLAIVSDRRWTGEYHPGAGNPVFRELRLRIDNRVNHGNNKPCIFVANLYKVTGDPDANTVKQITGPQERRIYASYEWQFRRVPWWRVF